MQRQKITYTGHPKATNITLIHTNTILSITHSMFWKLLSLFRCPILWSALFWGALLVKVNFAAAAHPEDTQARPSWQNIFHKKEGDVSAVYDLLDRVLWSPSSSSADSDGQLESPSSHFVLQLCNGNNAIGENSTSNIDAGGCSCDSLQNDTEKQHGWFCMEQEQDVTQQNNNNDNDNETKNRILVMASSISELSYGIGYYLRYHCNLTLGWDRIGGSVRNLTLPPSRAEWPVLSKPVQMQRRVPWSYLMNVCTHSYSLVWYDWKAWEAFLDWASLMGINNLLACKLQQSSVPKSWASCFYVI